MANDGTDRGMFVPRTGGSTGTDIEVADGIEVAETGIAGIGVE
jgi:hypothetical protein